MLNQMNIIFNYNSLPFNICICNNHVAQSRKDQLFHEIKMCSDKVSLKTLIARGFAAISLGKSGVNCENQYWVTAELGQTHRYFSETCSSSVYEMKQEP